MKPLRLLTLVGFLATLVAADFSSATSTSTSRSNATSISNATASVNTTASSPTPAANASNASNPIPNPAIEAAKAKGIPLCTIPCLSAPVPPPIAADPTLMCLNDTLQAGLALCIAFHCDIDDQYQAFLYRRALCVDHPSNDRSHVTWLVGVTFGPIALAAIVLRFFSKALMKGPLSSDDYVMLTVVLTILGLIISEILNSRLGFGKHFWDINPHHTISIRKIFWIGELFYVISLGLVKISIVLFCRRVLWIKTWFRRLSAVVLVWSVLTTLSIFLATLLQCQPMHLIWDSLYPKHCINLKKLAYASAALNVVQDLVIFIMPLPAFWVLQMNLRQKIGVMAMFSFGLVACILSIIRVPFIVTLSNSADFSYSNVDPTILSFAEFSIGTICACMPYLRHLLARCFTVTKTLTNSFLTRRANNTEDNGTAAGANPNVRENRFSASTGGNRLSRASYSGHILIDPTSPGARTSLLATLQRKDTIDLQPISPAEAKTGVSNRIWVGDMQKDPDVDEDGIIVVRNSLEQNGYNSGEEEEDCRRYGIRGLDGVMEDEAVFSSEVTSLDAERETEKDDMV